MIRKLLLLCLILAFTFSCAQRKVSSPAGGALEEGASAVAPGKEEKEIGATKEIGEEEVARIETAEIEEPKSAVLTEKEREEILKDIHFDFDKYNIKDEDKPTLRRVADWMLQNPNVRLIIEGHCDERGTNEYNLGLGDRRATSTKDYLVSLGVPESRLQTVSYGEERPLCTEHNEDCWAKNRRAHFVVIEGE